MTSVPKSEGVPTVVMEAMAIGLPIVTTEVGGVRDIVHHGEQGFVVPPLDPSALARATVPLLDDPELRRRTGEAGRRFAVERCRTEMCLRTHLHAFEVAAAHRAARNGGSRNGHPAAGSPS
jgi:glycosyltransferase involved in cell wall biosynthesis